MSWLPAAELCGILLLRMAFIGLIPLLICLFITTYVPGVVTWLPNMLLGAAA